CTILGSSYPYW
nr:immunoglobulin heavy chain junction region [Mus musculus]